MPHLEGRRSGKKRGGEKTEAGALFPRYSTSNCLSLQMNEGLSVLVREYLEKGGFSKALAEFDAQLLDKELKKNQETINHTDEMEVTESSRGGGCTREEFESTSSGLPHLLSLPTAAPRNLSESYMKTYLAEDLIVFGINSGEVSLYSTGYDDLRSWALSSLEMVKVELLAVCFPVFVHW